MAPFALTNRNLDPRISPVRGPAGYVSPWEYKSGASTEQSPLGGARTANAPSGVEANDLLHASVFSSPDIATPVGWTKMFSGNTEAYWRVATATSADDFAMTENFEDETGRLVIITCFRQPGEVPTSISNGGADQVVGTPAPMQIADQPFNQSGVPDTLLIGTCIRTGTEPVDAPSFTGVALPYKNTITPLYAAWGGPTDRFAYLGTAYLGEEFGSKKPLGNFLWGQFENSLLNTVSDSRTPRFSIV